MPEPSATGVWPAGGVTAVVERPAVPGYELLDELGRGGMGVVYKARHLATDRLVALKLIRDGALAGSQERARFRVEAEAAARVRHPNVVDVIEIGEYAGLPYFAMELVEGGSLADRLDGRPMAARDAASLIRTLAGAVHHAHERQIVHRDLKPANILIGSSEFGVRSAELRSAGPGIHSELRIPNSALLKIADFGLAKRLEAEATALTRDGAVLGTVGYMAPEQAAGRAREIGPAVDIYALGAILYELLTGRPPFEADSHAHTIQQVLHDEPAPPTRVAADVPRDLETICLKCLEKEPGRRYATAGELEADLDRFLFGTRITAVPVGEAERLARLAARDGYRIIGEVGRGPRSVVYRATFGPLDQPVAVKVFLAGGCTRDEWDGRLRRGAEQRAVLSHPNLLPVLGAGWWDGAGYVAVEYVPQGNLAGLLGPKPLPVKQVLHLVEQVGEVAAYLHRQGVVHGNLKPTNVLLAADGIPRVTDLCSVGGFFLGPVDGDGAGLLAPEVLAGSEPRQNTDVYGLGLILYELLTGRAPFADADDARYRDAVPPSAHRPDVHPALDTVCLRCLRKNPWRRYPRAFDVVKRVRVFQADAEVVDYRPLDH
jgi:serine/threonine protein kinase